MPASYLTWNSIDRRQDWRTKIELMAAVSSNRNKIVSWFSVIFLLRLSRLRILLYCIVVVFWGQYWELLVRCFFIHLFENGFFICFLWFYYVGGFSALIVCIPYFVNISYKMYFCKLHVLSRPLHRFLLLFYFCDFC